MIFSIILILGTTQTVFAGTQISVLVQKTTTSGDGVFTFDLINNDNPQNPVLDTCSIDTSTQSSCSLLSGNTNTYLVKERPQAGWMQDSTTCPGVIDADITPTVTCAFVNSPKLAVGGELFPIDTTSLILASTQNTAAWMIPIIVAAAGFGLIIQTQKTRLKHNSCPSCKTETDDIFKLAGKSVGKCQNPKCRVNLFFVE